ncbi:ABC transporter ATP-binding protein [Xenorhabdus szentirmaii]|uniref:ABC Transporter, ATP-binding protein n=2 Tax=Xenorhabdus szentirmaii TaxID=290112 RepID=W1J366_9GAMM|nr:MULTISPECIES: ABC transporter ATP-binding protein [Xenorhabdus]MBD2792275.1 ABC transporter ATP-binding protein [Xenorhabdus sp. CUL]MBD2800913.1 ABC transporter ATP-binding protein [Xenorhabdus sp. M]MBD2806198.1 ABC transporter ATP-binding protein [Xenorhabdus sp. ZM]MBD2819272.1 ABC transporter ATP-binding protein [Xenorhabdus sp. 42]MBD2823744.1 ABC transporter ATP-binding protein [Xenorhabdus sp. 5]
MGIQHSIQHGIQHSTQDGEKVIEFDQVRKHYKDFQALKGITLEVKRGEFIGLLGPNGAGKTTLVEILQGLKKQDSGAVRVLGRTWQQDSPYLRQRLSGVLQETLFIRKLKVEEILNLFGSFYGCSRQRTQDVMELVELTEKRKAYVEGLSGGQRQRLALGVAIMNEPEILILDEPTTGLDPRFRHDTWDILRKLNREKQSTMLLTTHYMEEAEYLCDRICIMNKGEIIAQGSMDNLLKQYCHGDWVELSTQFPERLQPLSQHAQVLSYEFDKKKNKIYMMTNESTSFVVYLFEFAKQVNVNINELVVRKKTLDDLFMTLAGRRFHE